MNSIKYGKKLKGFTLVELLVVMALIAVLAVLILGAIQLARNTATETTHRSNAKVVQAALEAQFAKYKRYCAPSTTAGEITCPGGVNGPTGVTSGYSLASIAASILPAVNLSNGSSTSGVCLVGGTGAGGGRITNLTSNGYAVVPSNYNCSSTNFNDVVQTGLSPALTATSLPTF